MNSPLFNPGRVVVRGSNWFNGAFTNATSSVLRMEGPNNYLTFREGITNGGTVEMADASRLYVTNGALINGPGATLHILPDGFAASYVIEAQLDNRGLVRVRRPLALNKPGTTHVNGPTGTILAEDDFAVTGGGFLNQGTFRKTAGSLAEETFRDGLQNTGLVEILRGGMLRLFGLPPSSNSGRITVEEGGQLTLARFTQTADGVLAGAGTVRFTATSSTIAGTYMIGTTSLDGGTARFTTEDARTGALRFTAAFGSTLLIPAGGGLTVFDDDVQTRGTVAVDGVLLVYGSLNVQAGSTFTVRGALAYAAAGVLTAGSVTVRDGGFLQADGDFVQTAGTTTLLDGVLSAVTVDVQGGTLGGTGTIGGDVVNAGQLVVGGAGAAGALHVAGNYTQTADGRLGIELGGLTPGTEHDYLSVDGVATLAGELSVALLAGFRPAADDGFAFLSFSGRDGDFAAFDGLDLGDGRALAPFFDDFGYYLWAYDV